MTQQDARLIECSAFLEFSANANRIQTREEICNHLLLTVMGRFAISRGLVRLADGREFQRGPAVEGPWPHAFEIAYENEPQGTLYLGDRAVGSDLSESQCQFVRGLCSLTATFMGNIQSREALKQANRRLSKKILELNALFEISRELVLTDSVERASQLCLNELAGQLMLREMVIGVRGRDDQFRLIGRGVSIPAATDDPAGVMEGLGLTVVNVDDKVVLGAGRKMDNRPFGREDREFSTLLLHFLVTTVDNIRMVEDRLAMEKLEREIRIARDIQQRLLPESLPDIPGITLTAKMETYGEVGGDYYDAVALSPEEVLFLVADVTGKGIPASLIMAAVQSAFRTLSETVGRDLEAMIRTLNRLLCNSTENNKFVSLFLGLIDVRAGQLTYINAGHNQPVLFNRGSTDSVRRLACGGMVLGLFEDSEHVSESIALQPGDRIFLFTDGLTELTDEKDNEFGEAALEELLLELRQQDCRSLMLSVVEQATGFARHQLVDDITVMCVGYEPACSPGPNA